MNTFFYIITKVLANSILNEIEKLNDMLQNVEDIAKELTANITVEEAKELIPIVSAMTEAGMTDEEIIEALILGKTQFDQDVQKENELTGPEKLLKELLNNDDDDVEEEDDNDEEADDNNGISIEEIFDLMDEHARRLMEQLPVHHIIEIPIR